MDILGINKKVKAEKDAEKKKRAEVFLKEYKELSSRHKFDITAELSVNAGGISPILRVIEVIEK